MCLWISSSWSVDDFSEKTHGSDDDHNVRCDVFSCEQKANGFPFFLSFFMNISLYVLSIAIQLTWPRPLPNHHSNIIMQNASIFLLLHFFSNPGSFLFFCLFLFSIPQNQKYDSTPKRRDFIFNIYFLKILFTC